MKGKVLWTLQDKHQSFIIYHMVVEECNVENSRKKSHLLPLGGYRIGAPTKHSLAPGPHSENRVRAVAWSRTFGWRPGRGVSTGAIYYFRRSAGVTSVRGEPC